MKLLFFALFLFSFNAVAVDIGLSFNQSPIKQGEIVSAKIKIDANSFQELQLNKLKEKTLVEMIYIYDVGSVMRKEGQQYLEADAKIIFLKIPENNELNFTEEGKQIKLFWDKVEILPTQEEKSFLYGAFSVPERIKPGMGIFIVLIMLMLTSLGYFVFKKQKLKKQQKLKISKLKEKIISCTTYEDVVALWMERQSYLTQFPQIENAFRKFEQTLFKYQFKPSQTIDEKNKVQSAYQDFVAEIKAGLHGI